MTNKQRAELGHAALQAGSPDFDSAFSAMVDTLTNIMHFARTCDLEWYEEAEATARTHFDAECCSACGGDVDNGEGYDGLCGNCADKETTKCPESK